MIRFIRLSRLLRISCVVFSAGTWLLTATAADQSKSKDGWVDLLAGNNLTKHWTTTGNWLTEPEGVVHLKPREGESGWTRYASYLFCKEQYADFEAEFEYKLERDGNSGFYFHVGDVKDPVSTGIEVQIYESASRPPNHQLVDHDSGGIIPGIPPTKNTSKPAGEWNRFHITCKGSKLTVALNGETVNEVDLEDGQLKSRPKTGAIGFQDHGMPVWLRNIRIRAL